MTVIPYFSSSSKVWESIEWVYGIRDAGYEGWEIVADGRYRLDDPGNRKAIREVVESTGLGITVHAPYGDLNLATLNHPIWEESVQQICRCIVHAAEFTSKVTIHPGYLSPVGKLLPESAWRNQKDALRRIGQVAAEHGVIACLENMIGIKEFLCQRPFELAGMTEGIEGIGITIDFGHANTVGQVREFLPLISSANHIHLHDNHGLSDEHLALGEGTIEWEKVGPAVRKDYSGVTVIEGRSLDEAKTSMIMFRKWFL
jgi:sugar phosphate isomerase/epimerase